ncbi:MAG: methionyl-tRNA formyltransferase [Patescibacteria group bacterium]|nr:methionyl-tRNA formyltransferase [Patescibacteria group bacterium]
MKIIFFGTREFAAEILKTLIESGEHEIPAVFTAPDRPVGRKQEIQKSPVKILAEKNNIRIFQPENLKNISSPFIRHSLNVVCEYGLMIPKNILEEPEYKSINIHPSLLPKYRGASPIQTALINGETETGVSIMLMDEKMDHGPVLAQKAVKITNTDNYATLAEKLLKTAKFLLLDTIRDWVEGKIRPEPQNDSDATFCKIFTREDGQIDFNKTALETYNQWRGFHPWPGVWFVWNGRRIKLLKIAVAADKKNPPGEFSFEENKLFLGTKNGSLEILELQTEGKKPMNAKEFANGISAFRSR